MHTYIYVQEKFGCPNCRGIFEFKTGKCIGELVKDGPFRSKVGYVDYIDI